MLHRHRELDQDWRGARRREHERAQCVQGQPGQLQPHHLGHSISLGVQEQEVLWRARQLARHHRQAEVEEAVLR